VIYLNRVLAQLGSLKYRDQEQIAGQPRETTDSPRGLQSPLRHAWACAEEISRRAASGYGRAVEDASLLPLRISIGRHKKLMGARLLASPPSIWINKKDEKPSGIVEEHRYEALLEMITQKLCELKDPRSGQPIVPRVYRRNKLFHGPFANEAPDLILDWWSENSFSIKTNFPKDGDQPTLKIR
jgi:predicted AlkP superfamily phosphohydrolase/phosphomutase